MVARSDVVRLVGDGGVGTGFFISRTRLVTVWHVLVPDGSDEEPTQIEVDHGQGEVSTPVTLVAFDRHADWAVLEVHAPAGTRSWRVWRAHQFTPQPLWGSYGFPTDHGVGGMALTGHVASVDAPRFSRRDRNRSVPSIQLFCDEAAAGYAQDVPGFSGGPVVVDGRVLGVIREFLPVDDKVLADKARAGTVDAVPISSVLDGLVRAGQGHDLHGELRGQYPHEFESVSMIGRIADDGRIDALEGDADPVRAAMGSTAAVIFVAPGMRQVLVARDRPIDVGLDLARVHAAGHVDLVLARLGLVEDDRPLTGVFAAARRDCESTVDWRGDARSIAELTRLKLTEDRRVIRLEQIVRELEPLPGAVATIEGGPGSGKSFFLRQLHHALSLGELRFDGPSLLVNARECRTLDLQSVLATWAPPHQRMGELLDREPSVAQAVWLLVDGLDELPAERRRALIEQLRLWRGPVVISTRNLHADVSTRRRFGVEPFPLAEAKTILRAAGATELLARFERHPAQTRWPPDPRPPDIVLFEQIASTPLGVSMLALSDADSLDSRQQFFGGIMAQELRRAVEAGRGAAEDQTEFEIHGERFTALLAWRMVDTQHTTATADDLRWVGTKLGSDTSRLLATMGRLGFLERVGHGHWEFVHKSFTEYWAARAAVNDDVNWRLLLGRLGDSGADEILLNLASFEGWANIVIQELLAEAERPLTALSVGVRAAFGSRPGSLDPELLTELVVRKLGIVSWFGNVEIPGAVGRSELEWLIERHAGALSPSSRRLLDACHPDVGAWLRNEEPVREEGEFAPSPYDLWSQRRSLATFLAVHLDAGLSLEQLLNLDGALEHLRKRGRGPWARELLTLVDGDDAHVARQARMLWTACAPERELLTQLRFIDGWHDPILEVVGRHGSSAQVREALLRAARVEADPQSLQTWHDAWAQGKLWLRDQEKAEAVLYARLIDDGEPLARWAALRARERGPEDWRLDDEALELHARDADRHVRIEALQQLITRGLGGRERLGPSLDAADDVERWGAWAGLSDEELGVDLDQLLEVIRRRTAPRAWNDKMPIERELDGYGDPARRQLCRRIASLWRGELDRLAVHLEHDQTQEAATKVLEELDVERRRALYESQDSRLRRWILRNSYSVEPATLERLCEDPDPEVVKLAASHLDRVRSVDVVRYVEPPQMRTMHAPEFQREFARFDSNAVDGEWPQALSVSVETLIAADSHEALWELLGTRALEWMDILMSMFGMADEFSPIVDDYHGPKRAGESRVLQRLEQLHPSAGQADLIAALSESQRGYFATLLLRARGIGPEILDAFERGPMVAIRAGWVCVGSSQAELATQRLVECLCRNLPDDMFDDPRMVFGYTRPERLFSWRTHWWLSLPTNLDGLRGSVCFARATPAQSRLRVHVLQRLAADLHASPVLCAHPARADLVEFVRAVANDTAAPESARYAALLILAAVGDGDDAEAWRGHHEAGNLSEALTDGALRLLGGLARAQDRTYLLGVAASTLVPAQLVAALEGLAGYVGERDVVAQALAWLEKPRPPADDTPPRFQSWRRPAAWLVARGGSDAQLHRLAELLIDDEWGCSLLDDLLAEPKANIRPAHGLLILGAARHSDHDDNSGRFAEANTLFHQLRARVDTGELRDAFARILCTPRSTGSLDADFFLPDLGGVLAQDVPLFLERLEADPADLRALQHLAEAGAGERELVALWQRHGVPWWP